MEVYPGSTTPAVVKLPKTPVLLVVTPLCMDEIIHAQKEELFQEKNEKVNTIDILQKAALDVKALKNALDTERLKVETQVKERNGKSFKIVSENIILS